MPGIVLELGLWLELGLELGARARNGKVVCCTRHHSSLKERAKDWSLPPLTLHLKILLLVSKWFKHFMIRFIAINLNKMDETSAYKIPATYQAGVSGITLAFVHYELFLRPGVIMKTCPLKQQEQRVGEAQLHPGLNVHNQDTYRVISQWSGSDFPPSLTSNP